MTRKSCQTLIFSINLEKALSSPLVGFLLHKPGIKEDLLLDDPFIGHSPILASLRTETWRLREVLSHPQRTQRHAEDWTFPQISYSYFLQEAVNWCHFAQSLKFTSFFLAFAISTALHFFFYSEKDKVS